MRGVVATSLLTAVLVGCAAPRVAQVTSDQSSATTKSADPKADLTLSQIMPQLQASVAPTTAPATQPSLTALEAYARGRGALAERQIYTAVDFLEKAASLDAQSPHVQHQLGRAYIAAGKLREAMTAFANASQLDPTWLDAYLDLARLQLRLAPNEALGSLISATHTRDYATSDADAATVDFYLARELQQAGYDRAAIEQYEKLLWRLSRKSLSIRGQADLAALANRPEPLQLELAKLYEKRGQTSRAIAMYQQIAQRAPEAFEPQARLVRAQIAAGQVDAAIKRSTELITRFRANPLSIELLRESYRAAGDDRKAIAVLQDMHRSLPADRNLLLALADALVADGRSAEAEKLIAEAAARVSPNVDLLRKLVRIHSDRNETTAAAKLLIEASANNPESAMETAHLWQPLIRQWRVNALRPEDLRSLSVSAAAEPARLYWMSRLYSENRRETQAHNALIAATSASPLFPPAYILRVQQIWSHPQTPVKEKEKQTAALVLRARQNNDEALALQLEAIAASFSMPSPTELPFFEKAITAGNASPEFTLAYAKALLQAKDVQKYEQVMWKLLSDDPHCDDAYRHLMIHYNSANANGPAMKVVNTWLAADPKSTGARIGQAAVLARLRQFDAAEELLRDLIEEDPTDPDPLNELVGAYTTTNRAAQALELLEAIRLKDPGNFTPIDVEVRLRFLQGETPAALRTLEAAAKAAPEQANLLYQLASWYYSVGEKAQSEALMERALRADPTHVPSSNDLAYYWSEAGKKLAESERLARQAVAAEPENSAYLDTLGWVLYKQGRFEEARRYLEQAVAAASPIDPVLLDHLGDVQYRLSDADSAVKSWTAANELLRGVQLEREEYAKLRLELQNKLRQQKQNQPVEVSPTAEARTNVP